MAFEFDYTLQGTSSNSYVPLSSYTLTHDSTDYSILGADDYFARHPKYDTWNKLSTTQKQQFLVRASLRLDAETWSGRRTNSNQALQFPRLWMTSRDFLPSQEFLEFTDGNYYQDSFRLPHEIERACCELALSYVEEWLDELPFASRQDQERLQSFSVGPITQTLRKAREDKLPDIVVRLLRAFSPDGWRGEKFPTLVR